MREVSPGIMVDPRVVHGRPVVAGTRVPVGVVLSELAGGSTYDDVMREYHLTVEQIRAALAYAASVLARKRPSVTGMYDSADYIRRHAEAQTITSFRIAGRTYDRIRYGDEVEERDWIAFLAHQGAPCDDCGVPPGDFHLTVCDLEQCPRCHGQAVGCACGD